MAASSILESVKKVLGLPSENTDFDTDVIMHINSIFSVLNELGIGPVDGFMIEDAASVWSDFIAEVKPLNMVQSYMYLRVRLLFDPPTTSYLIESMNSQVQELGWRINVYRESLLPLPPTTEVLV